MNRRPDFDLAPARRRLLGAVAAVVLTTLAWPAAADQAAALVGRWVLINQAAALQIEFHADGTYRAFAPQATMRGKWALVDDEHLATWSGDDRPRRVNRFRINGNNLVITDANGTHHVHRRDPMGLTE